MKKLDKKGFSLVELIIVIAIMAVLIGVLAPTYLGHVKSSKISADLQNAQSIATELAVAAVANDVSGTDFLAHDGKWHKISDKVNTVPAIQGEKVNNTDIWVYLYDETNVHVGIGADNEAKADDYHVELYPSVDHPKYKK